MSFDIKTAQYPIITHSEKDIRIDDKMLKFCLLPAFLILIGQFYPTQAANDYIACDPTEKLVNIIAHPNDCRKYFICQGSTQIIMLCPLHLAFDPNLKVCNFAWSVNCDQRNAPVKSAVVNNLPKLNPGNGFGILPKNAKLVKEESAVE